MNILLVFSFSDWQAFYHYHYAATHAHPAVPLPAHTPSLASPFSPALDTAPNTGPSPGAGQARAQAMVAFLMTLHPEVAPAPYSKQVRIEVDWLIAILLFNCFYFCISSCAHSIGR